MIIGNAETLKKARSAGPEAGWNHVNFDAIDSLPEEFEAVITEVRYDPKQLGQAFSDVGNSTYMPKPELMYAIAEACGISGGEKTINEPLIEEVDFTRITADVMAPPQMVRMTVGRTVSKYSEVMQEDGTMRRSSICTSSYNAYERCSELWSKEEMYTEGYAKKGKYDDKYKTRWQRRAHFDNELKFSGAKAETKAHLKTIRELAGLMTGYKITDLTSGMLVFYKIRRSSAVLKMETAARLSAISRGNGVGMASALLFGNDEPKKIAAPTEIDQTVYEEIIDFVESPAQDPKSAKEQIIYSLSKYKERGTLSIENVAQADKIIGWLEKVGPEPHNSPSWDNVLKSFLSIDESVIPEGRIAHHF